MLTTAVLRSIIAPTQHSKNQQKNSKLGFEARFGRVPWALGGKRYRQGICRSRGFYQGMLIPSATLLDSLRHPNGSSDLTTCQQSWELAVFFRRDWGSRHQA
jgi:hypothetical protein